MDEVYLQGVSSKLGELVSQTSRLADAAQFTGPIESYWLAYFTVAIAGLGALFAGIQLGALRAQAERESARQQRVAALSVLSEFNKGMRPEFDSLGDILSGLCEKDFCQLWKEKKLTVSHEKIPVVTLALSHRLEAEQNTFFDEASGKLGEKQAVALKSIISDFVNHLENALAPVFTRVADERTVLAQLSPYLTGEIRKDFEPLWRYFGMAYLPFTIEMLDRAVPSGLSLDARRELFLSNVEKRRELNRKQLEARRR
ncbi:hypothetical protein [Roseobacter sinensis]|uniref:LemA family protein n=1 Tax=Roseobacter sinensis TaxID=2931391 RepID=A0ABT3BF30_9RHOB|nr:hypothetical protein [Roseobacter sp. WL0113]MCV3272182.1 hypothetical protein [Roseobacter sp. WL0113]